MDKIKLYDALDGLFAYDIGCTDSGIKDENLRREVANYLGALNDKQFRLIISEFIREYYLSTAALAQGYGVEDVVEFIKWMPSYLGIDI